MIKSSSPDNRVHIYSIEILNTFDIELQLIDTKLEIKNKLKELLGELKNFKAHTSLVSEYKKNKLIINQCVKLFIQVLNQFLMIHALMKHSDRCIKLL